ncbi:MAG: NUDIX domain-containing protein [Spirosomataceae bacterium]
MTPAREEAIAQYGNQLRVRVCGILVEDNQMLLIKHQAVLEAGVYWSPPGGGVQFGESAREALCREFLEETHLQIEVVKLLFVNQFLRPPLHAIELYFEVKRLNGSEQLGSDPELSNQLMEAVVWLTWPEIEALSRSEKASFLSRCRTMADVFSQTGYYDED